MPPTHTYTLYSSIYNIDGLTELTESWADICARFSSHTVCFAKDQAPGFGPYSVSLSQPCAKHSDGLVRTTAHRCDGSIQGMTLLVFDVDKGTEEQVAACDQQLADAGLARLWYSTYSHSLAKPAYRLIVPSAAPVAPRHWRVTRETFIQRFAVPCDPKQCGGKSHFYYMPSRPSATLGVVRAFEGAAFEPFGPWLFVEPPPRPPSPEWNRPPEPEEEVSLVPARMVLEQRLEKLERSKAETKRPQILRRLLSGQSLAEKGERNLSMCIAAGIVAWALPDLSVGTLMRLLQPSLDVMVNEGSKLSYEKTERMLLSALKNRAETMDRRKAEQDANQAFVQRAESKLADLQRAAHERAAARRGARP